MWRGRKGEGERRRKVYREGTEGRGLLYVLAMNFIHMIMSDSKYIDPCSGHYFICPIFGGSKDEGCCCKFYQCFCQIVHLRTNINFDIEDSNYTILLNFITIISWTR